MKARVSSFPAAAALLSCIVCTSLAHAQRRSETARAITVRGESSCVSAAALRSRIARYLSADVAPAELSIVVDLAADPPGFRVVRAGRSIAERRFDRLPPGCAERRDAIALTIAVAIEHAPSDVGSGATNEATAAPTESPAGTPPPSSEPANATVPGTSSPANRTGPQPPAAGGADQPVPDAAQPVPRQSATQSSPVSQPTAGRRAPQPSAASATPPAPPAEHEHEHEPEPASERPEASRAWQRPSERWMLHGGAVYLLEALPTPLPAFVVGAEFAVFPALRLSLSGLVSTRPTLEFSPGTVAGQLFGGQAFACLNTPFFAMILHGCAGAAAALAHAKGDGYAESSADEMAWLAGVLRLLIEVPATGSVAARLVASGHVNLIRPELLLERQDAEAQTKSARLIGASIGAEILVRVD